MSEIFKIAVNERVYLMKWFQLTFKFKKPAADSLRIRIAEKATASSILAFIVFHLARIMVVTIVRSSLAWALNACGFAHRFGFYSFFCLLLPHNSFVYVVPSSLILSSFFNSPFFHWAVEHMVEQFYSNCEYMCAVMKLKLCRTIFIMKADTFVCSFVR